MHLDSSKLWILYTLWAVLLLGGLVVTARLLFAAIKNMKYRWWRLPGAAVTVAATLGVTSVWINPATTGRYNCTMDGLSTAFASDVSTVADHSCAQNGRLRVGLSSGVEFVVLASGLWLATLRPRRREVTAEQIPLDAK